MNLSPIEIKRFYSIWLPLLNYVNDQTRLVVDFPRNPAIHNIDIQDAAKIRNALWESPDYLQGFVENNPAELSQADLALAASWRYRVSGSFYIMRCLKKHTIFLWSSEQPVAYGVLGLVSPIEEMLYLSPPVMVKAVLLPYEGKIIYDGLIAPFNIRFGGGIKKSLMLDLRRATELNGIVTTLEPDEPAKNKPVVDGNQKILTEFHKSLINAGLSEKLVLQHYSIVGNFVTIYLQQAQPPCSLLKLNEDHLSHYFSIKNNADHRVSFKRLIKFLVDSDRIDIDTYRDMEVLLKKLQHQQ